VELAEGGMVAVAAQGTCDLVPMAAGMLVAAAQGTCDLVPMVAGMLVTAAVVAAVAALGSVGYFQHWTCALQVLHPKQLHPE